MQSDMLRAQRSGANPMMRVRPTEIHLRDRLAVFSRYRYVALLAPGPEPQRLMAALREEFERSYRG